jgi:hypothetical protein
MADDFFTETTGGIGFGPLTLVGGHENTLRNCQINQDDNQFFLSF